MRLGRGEGMAETNAKALKARVMRQLLLSSYSAATVEVVNVFD